MSDEPTALVTELWKRAEAELADTRDEYDMAMSELKNTQAELADLRASSVVVRERCDVLGCVDGFIFEGDEGDVPCPDRDNGWRLAEGVERRWRCIKAGDLVDYAPAIQQCHNMSHEGCDWVYLVPPIPARLIEGEE